MWTRIVFPAPALVVTVLVVTVLVITALATSLRSEEPAPQPAAGNLLAHVKWLRLEVVGGRVAIRADRCSQSRLTAESPPTDAVRQTLSLESKAHAFIARYERADDSQGLLLEVSDAGVLTLTRKPNPRVLLPEVCYSQPVTGKVKLTIGGPQPQTICATDFWQLCLAERAAADEHLLPLLLALRPQWRLREELAAIESALALQAGDDVLRPRTEWNRWLDDLDHAEFEQRQAADMALRVAGQPVLAHLRQLDLRELSGEQRRRVRSMLADLPDGAADSPERVAHWLVADKRVWLALLARGDLDQRMAAAQHLSHLCRRPLRFNPQGTADERSAQLAELAAKLADNN